MSSLEEMGIEPTKMGDTLYKPEDELDEILSNAFNLTHDIGLKKPSKDWFYSTEIKDEDFEDVNGAVFLSKRHKHYAYVTIIMIVVTHNATISFM